MITDFKHLSEEKHTNKQWVKMLDVMRKTWVKVPEWVNYHFLGAVPPIYCNKGFLCGEPLTHNKEGKAVYRYFFKHKNDYYGTISSKETADFNFELFEKQLREVE